MHCDENVKYCVQGSKLYLMLDGWLLILRWKPLLWPH